MLHNEILILSVKDQMLNAHRMLIAKYRVLHVKYNFPKHVSSIYCSDFDMVTVLDLAVPVYLQRRSWSVAPESFEPLEVLLQCGLMLHIMWLNTTHKQ